MLGSQSIFGVIGITDFLMGTRAIPFQTSILPRLLRVFGVALFCFCAAHTQAQTVKPEHLQRMQELRPSIKAEDTTAILRTRKAKRPNAFKLQDNARIDSLLDTLHHYNLKIKAVPGYRIQVYAGVDRAAAFKTKETLYKTYPELEVYVQFAQPTFKVKCGDFLTRLEALSAHSKLKLAFPTAVVMPDMIRPRK